MELTIPTFPMEKGRIPDILEENNIRTNPYAQQFFRHERFSTAQIPARMELVIRSVAELGLPDGAVLSEIIAKARASGLGLCHPAAGVFLRLQYCCQPESGSSVLSGTHQSPEGAIIVLSDLLEQDEAFPKGLYLRNVDGTLWLRGYVCAPAYVWDAKDVFVFSKEN